MAYTSWSVVFGEQPSANKWNILGTNDAHFYSFLGDNLTWQDWSPSYSNITVGSGTVAAKYIQIGKTVHFAFKFVYGSGSAVGANPTISLPVTASSSVYSNGYAMIGQGSLVDTGNKVYPVFTSLESTTTFSGTRLVTASGSNPVTTEEAGTSISAGAPFTWGSGDSMHFTGTYEAA